MSNPMQYKGMLSGDDIFREMLSNEIKIFPFEKGNLTDVGYNLTSSSLLFSVKRGILLEININSNEKFVWVDPMDTVLILTREYVSVSKRIAGTFHSRVRIVSQGFSHISTTLDPEWSGPLLIALNNPSNKKKKFILESNNGKGMTHVTFVTLSFHYLFTPVQNFHHDNAAFRLDILKQYYFSSSFSKRTSNKSFLLLDEILEYTQKMSPDIPFDTSFPEFNDELHKYLISCLDCYLVEQDSDLLITKIKEIHFRFLDIIRVSSPIFKKQILSLLDLAERLHGTSDSSINDLILQIEISIDGCTVENKVLRWQHYSGHLEKLISDYRISRWMRISVWYYRNWRRSIYTVISVLLICITMGALIYMSNQGKIKMENVLLSILPTLAAFLLNYFLVHGKDKS